MVNTILARRVNHIVAKGDNPAWPKGSKSRGFSVIHGIQIYSPLRLVAATCKGKQTAIGIRKTLLQRKDLRQMKWKTAPLVGLHWVWAAATRCLGNHGKVPEGL